MNRGRRISMLLLGTLASWLTAVPAGHALRVTCDKSPYDVDLAVIHANGMHTTFDEAVANLEHLRPLVDQRLGQQAHAISYALAYNEKKNWFESIRKVIRERMPMTEADQIRMLLNSSDLPDDLRDVLRQKAADLDQSGFQDDPSLEKQVQMYRDHLRAGHRVVVVAHSEGNMYSNAAYARLFQGERPEPGSDEFGIVGVAVPTVRLAGAHPKGCSDRGCYTTLAQDEVIAAVVKATGDTAPANITEMTKGADDLGHGFITSYLPNAAARAQILEHVAWFVESFGPLAATINDSMVTAYLDWDTDADLDLHVFEASGGQHVYTTYPDAGGHLDADDRDGYGPEHYYAECDELRRGDFGFAVGYYAGDGPTTARLRVKIGDMVRTYTRTLPAPVGEISLAEPETFAAAHVLHDPDKSREALSEQYQIDLVSVPAEP